MNKVVQAQLFLIIVLKLSIPENSVKILYE